MIDKLAHIIFSLPASLVDKPNQQSEEEKKKEEKKEKEKKERRKEKEREGKSYRLACALANLERPPNVSSGIRSSLLRATHLLVAWHRR